MAEHLDLTATKAIKILDRFSTAGMHAQTLCAVAHIDFRLIGAHDYSQLFIQPDTLGLGPDVRAEVYRRMVFNVASANCDDYPKNFSFLLSKGRAWSLSPAYDVTHAHAPDSRWTKQHLMAVNGRTTGISRADIEEVGDRFAVPAATAVIDQVLDAVRGWRQFAETAGVPEPTAELVANDIQRWSAPLRRRSSAAADRLTGRHQQGPR